MSVIAYPLEATEYTAADAQTYLSTRKSGVYSDEITFTPEGMTVTVSPFLAWLNYAQFKGCSVAVTEPETLTFSPAHAVLDRIDRVVLRLDLTTNRAYLTVLEGEPSSNAVAPQISKTEIINDISPISVKIKAGATEITDADITSTILDENVCGIMRDGVIGIPTSQLQEQVEELIAYLDRAIKETEENSAFMMADIYDPDKKAKPVAFDDEVWLKNHPKGSIIALKQHHPNFEHPNYLGGMWSPVRTTSTIVFKEYVEIDAANTVYEVVFDIAKYKFERSSFAISALVKTSDPSTASISLKDVFYTSGAPEYASDEYVSSFSVAIKKTNAVSSWIHVTVTGQSLDGANHNIQPSMGMPAFIYERVN